MICIVAKAQVKPGTELQFEVIAKELVARSREEPGVADYTVWRAEGPGTYAFVERYRGEAAIDAHLKSEHYRRLGPQLGEFLQAPLALTRLHAL